MGPRVQTTTWLHELASGHHQGSQCIPEVRPWARCQDVLVLPLVLERCWITFWKTLSNYWGWKECSGGKKSIKLHVWEQMKGKVDRLLLDSVKAISILSCQAPVIWLSSSLENWFGCRVGTALLRVYIMCTRTMHFTFPEGSSGSICPFSVWRFLKIWCFLSALKPWQAWFIHTVRSCSFSRNTLCVPRGSLVRGKA